MLLPELLISSTAGQASYCPAQPSPAQGTHCFPEAQLPLSFTHPVLFLEWRHLGGPYLAERKGGLIAGNLLSPHSTSTHRTFWPKEQHPRTFQKVSVVFTRHLSGLRSTFLSVRNAPVRFPCGMQTATIFKQKTGRTAGEMQKQVAERL